MIDIDKFIMYNSRIFRNTQGYLDRKLKRYNLSSGAYPYLIVLENNEGVSQIHISKEIGNDRAMSARTINKLIESGFIYKLQDERDSRAYKLYLTSKAKEILPFIHMEIEKTIYFIAEGLTEDEKHTTMKVLKNIFEKTKGLKKGDNM